MKDTQRSHILETRFLGHFQATNAMSNSLNMQAGLVIGSLQGWSLCSFPTHRTSSPKPTGRRITRKYNHSGGWVIICWFPIYRKGRCRKRLYKNPDHETITHSLSKRVLMHVRKHYHAHRTTYTNCIRPT